MHATPAEYGAVAMLLAGALGICSWVARRRSARRADALLRIMREVGEQGNYSLRAEENGSGESSQLASAFNKMLSSIERRESALRSSEEHYREIFNAPSEALMIHHPETGEVLDVNQAMKSLYGMDPAEAGRMKVGDFSAGDPPYGQTEALAHIHRAAREGAHMFEWRARKKSGELFWCEVALKALQIDGRPRVLAVVRDITPRKHSEEALRESESKFRALFEHAFSGVALHQLITDAQGRPIDYSYLQVNPAYERHTGLSGASIAGKRVTEVIKGLESPPFLEAFARVALNGQSARFEAFIPQLKRHWEISAFPLKAGQFAAVLIDITDRKRREEDLKASEARYREIFDAPGEAISIHDAATGLVIDVNRRTLEIYGFSREECPGLSPSLTCSGIPPYSAEDAMQWMRRAIEEGPQVFEWHARRKNGELFWAEVSLKNAQLSGRDCIIAVVRDIQQRKQVEEELQHARRFTERMAQVLPSVVYVHDLESGRNVFVNREVSSYLGYSKEEVQAEAEDFLPKIMHPDDLPRFAAHRKRLQRLVPGQVLEFEYRMLHANGGWRWFHSRDTIFRCAADGTPAQIIGTATDFTEHRRMEEQLRQAQKMDAIGQLAGGVAHDFNNILAAMLMRLGLLQESAHLDAEVREAVEELSVGANRAANLTRQLLMFSRQSVMRVKPLDLNELVENLLKMLRRILGEHIHLEWQVRSNFLCVEADSGMLEQVIMNLCVNARDAMPGGGRLSLATDMLDLPADRIPQGVGAGTGQFVCLSVTDTGCGMSEALMKHIFEPFFTTKDVGKGTGLGLATAHGIVQQHRGWIEVESVVGRGSTFRVLLPEADACTLTPAKTSSLNVPRGRGETILLVEDEPGVRNVVAQCLVRHGYRVLEAESGTQALDLWLKHRQEIRLLFTDMVMPEGLTGLDLAGRLRDDSSDLKVILSSGYSPEATLAGSALDTEVILFPKPYDLTALAQIVRRCLDGEKFQ